MVGRRRAFSWKTLTPTSVPIIGLETTGSNCFYQSLALNPGAFPTHREPNDGVRAERNTKYDVTVANLPALTSRATSLGASSPAAGTVRMALDRKGDVKSVCVDDELAMQAALLFAGMLPRAAKYRGYA